MRLPLLCLLLFFCTTVFAQNEKQKEERPQVPPNVTIVQSLYRYSSFANGNIFFHNGEVLSGRFNYNVSGDEMHFIGEKGDTLFVSDHVPMDYISLNGSRFYYYKGGYLQTIDSTGVLMLAVRQKFIAALRNSGSKYFYRYHADTSRYDLFTRTGRTFKLNEDETTFLSTYEDYFIGDEFGRFSKANKKAVLNYYTKYQAEINRYLEINHIDFNKEEDLSKLLHYCSQFQQ